MSEWNAYYDRYVMGAALLLALIVSCNYVADSSIFLHLRAGKLIGERIGPRDHRRVLLYGGRPAVGGCALAVPVVACGPV